MIVPGIPLYVTVEDGRHFRLLVPILRKSDGKIIDFSSPEKFPCLGTIPYDGVPDAVGIETVAVELLVRGPPVFCPA